MSPSRRITINDVAAASGVSYQTVSRVINDHPNVAALTRSRVEQAIERLGFRPNGVARQLVTGRSNLLGLISLGTTYYGPSQMVAHTEQALRAKGFGLVVAGVSEVGGRALVEAIAYLRKQGVDGIILVTPFTDISTEQVTELCGTLPFVLVGAYPNEQCPTVAIDQRAGSALATEHLLELGHTRICAISGPLNWYDAVLRHEGWVATLEQADIEPGVSLEGDWSAASGYRATRRLLQAAENFTGLVVANDQMALGALYALRERGLNVPGDVAVVGFDDVPEAIYYTPSLTTIHQDFAALGQQCVAHLTALLNASEAPEQLVLSPTLVPRQSTLGVS